jgi:hypothetical protein
MPRHSPSKGESHRFRLEAEALKESAPSRSTHRHSSRLSQDILQRIIDEYSAQLKPGWGKSIKGAKSYLEAESIDLYRYCEKQLERIRMEKARAKLGGLRLPPSPPVTLLKVTLRKPGFGA